MSAAKLKVGVLLLLALTLLAGAGLALSGRRPAVRPEPNSTPPPLAQAPSREKPAEPARAEPQGQDKPAELARQDERPETGLNDQGFITTWLLLAAIPLEPNQSGADAVEKEQIKDEARLESRVGDKVKVGEEELVWKEYKARDYFFDFNDFLGNKAEHCAGYAVCYIHSDAERKDLTLKIGSDASR
jgi:hypothetical protein